MQKIPSIFFLFLLAFARAACAQDDNQGELEQPVQHASQKNGRNKEVTDFDLYRAGEVAYYNGDFVQSRRLLKLLTSRYPDSDWARRGDHLLEQMPNDEAPAAKAEADAPYIAPQIETGDDSTLASLKAAIASRNTDSALALAYDFLRRFPQHAAREQVSLAAGGLRLRRREYEKAVGLLRPLARSGSEDVRSKAQYLLGGALVALGQYNRVIDEISAADPETERDRWSALAQIWRAEAFAELGRGAQSEKLYSAIAAAQQPSPARTFALAAVAAQLDREGKTEKSLVQLDAASAEAARWGMPDLQESLALATAAELSRANSHRKSAAAYMDFTVRFPSSPLLARALYLRALELKRIDDKLEAVRALEDLLHRAPDSAYTSEAHLQLGQLNAQLGHTDSAVSHYKEIGETSPAKSAASESLLLQAHVYYNAKRYKDAVPLYRQYLQSATDDSKAREVRGLLLVSLWRSDRADPQIFELAKQIPDHPLVPVIGWDMAVDAYKRQDWAAAADLFQRQISGNLHTPRGAEATFYRAESLRQLGSADAAAAYQSFLDRYPKDTRSRQVAARLGALRASAGNYAGAAAAYSRITGEDSLASEAAFARLESLQKTGKETAAGWEKFATKFSRHKSASWAWWRAARIHEDAKHFDLAEADYARARGSEERAKSLFEIGKIEEIKRHSRSAIAAYEKLRNVLPSDDPARLAGLLRLALLYELSDKPRVAAPLYSEIVRVAPQDSPTLATAKKRLESLTKEKSLY